MADYLHAAVRMLQRKRVVETALDSLQEQIRYLEHELTSCRTTSYDSIRAGRCSGNGEEERRLTILAKLDERRRRYAVLNEEIEQVERGYSVLTPYQRDLLETFFASGERYCAEKLCERHFKERSQIYRDRKKALRRFATAVFGCTSFEEGEVHAWCVQ